MRWPGDRQKSEIRESLLSTVLFRRKRYYYKRRLFGAFASKAARQLTSLPLFFCICAVFVVKIVYILRKNAPAAVLRAAPPVRVSRGVRYLENLL